MRIDRSKFALIHFGNDECYGLVFVAGELKRLGEDIKWFDGDSAQSIQQIEDWMPDYVFFSPLTTFFKSAVNLSANIKKRIPKVKCVFGGHHVFATPESIEMKEIDIVVLGPVYGTINKIKNSKGKEIINGSPIPPINMIPSRKEYYEAIPRIAQRHRKYIMSHFGCMYNCSYCSTSKVRKFYGANIYNEYFLARRPVSNLIEEAKTLLQYDTKEFALEDDDILAVPQSEEWIKELAKLWKKKINRPIYANVSPITVVKASDSTMEVLSSLVDTVQMGVQAVTERSLKLFNRQQQNKEIVKAAFKKLSKFGIPVKMEFIMGLPIEDPVNDAIESIRMAQELNVSYIAAFPLMIYPGTDLSTWIRKNNIALNESCTSEWHTGIGSIMFDEKTNNRIRNLTKMATFFVKYKVSKRWIKCFIDMNMTESASKQLSECQYLESLVFRMGDEIEKDFDDILRDMDFKY